MCTVASPEIHKRTKAELALNLDAVLFCKFGGLQKLWGQLLAVPTPSFTRPIWHARETIVARSCCLTGQVDSLEVQNSQTDAGIIFA